MTTRILMVDGDRDFKERAARRLADRGYAISEFADGPPAIADMMEQGLPQVALVNFRLPSMPGVEFARKLKSIADVPIIFVACEAGRDIMVDGIRKYAEDFVVKPVNLAELEARLQIALRGMPGVDYANDPVVRVDDRLSVEVARNRILIDGETRGLTPIESTMLHALLRHAGRVIDNQTLLARVWPHEDVPLETLRVHMHRLRRKLEADAHHPHYIRTERGVGYRFSQRPADS